MAETQNYENQLPKIQAARGFKLNERVKRTNALGCHGTIREFREEVTASSAETRDKGIMVNVLWDNGTSSFFSPEALETVKE